jgi:hypothetical protein
MRKRTVVQPPAEKSYEELGRLFRPVRSRLEAIKKAEVDFENMQARLSTYEPKLAENMVKAFAMELNALHNAEPYFWEPEIVQLVVKGGKKLPTNVPFHRSWLNSRSGYWYLGQGSGLFGASSLELAHEPREIHALLWELDEARARLTMIPFTEQHRELTPGPVPLSTVHWPEGLTLQQAVEHNFPNVAKIEEVLGNTGLYADGASDWRTSGTVALQLFACGSLWLQQRVIVTDRTRLPKAFAKKLRHENVKPEINVIQLRRRQYEPTGAEPKAVDWKCRWIVGAIDGGFWRNQKTADGHKPIWIFPFEKGPSDKPLKLPGKRLFHVNR